jgi:hypothetical protein
MSTARPRAPDRSTHPLDAHALFIERQQVVEPVFGQIKNKGLIRIWLRGEEKAEHEWLLHCIGHNLSKLHGAWA